MPLRTYQEPVATWRAMAGQLAAILRVGRALRAGEAGVQTDLALLFGEEAAGLSGSTKRAVGEQRVRLGRLVNGWLGAAGTRPVFAWPFTADAPEVTVDAGAGGGEGEFAWPARSLYAELLTQLLDELTGP